MSSYLWKYYLQDDVDRFRHLLETATYNLKTPGQKAGGGPQNIGSGAIVGSPGALSTSPTLTTKSGRKSSGWGQAGTPQGGPSTVTLTRADINWRDGNGLTILHHAASSTSENAVDFAQALIDHPLTDLYLQDQENGWTALHRAFYFGNVTIARTILERDAEDALSGQGGAHHAVGLIKIKDKEGHGPLDLYSATIKDRTLRPDVEGHRRSGSDAGSVDERHPGDYDEDDEDGRWRSHIETADISGDEVLTFGSNRNNTLGFGNEDDRQFPERVKLRRPDHLLQRFYREHQMQHEKTWAPFDPSVSEHSRPSRIPKLPVESMPWTAKSRPLVIQDVHMSKLHTAVLTTDPESNLYMCGHGPGGRLGTGDERTRFNLVCIEGGALAGKKIATVALGQNHSLALSDEGEIFSWGNNGYGQLGYTLPNASLKDEDPVQTLPVQIFGPLKRELVIGVAASRIHSVAHTSSSIYTFGKNEGQLGIMDSDARSLDMQIVPRKVAASRFQYPIQSVSAIDKATICLLENHDVWVFANYGYVKVQFPLDGFSNYFLKQSFFVTKYDNTANHISKITSGGDTICALSSSGEVYTLSVSQHAGQSTSSTTNPAKIRDAISQPHRIWSLKKNNMAARDVGVDADGSIILTTEEGSVWKRSRRAKIKDASASGGDYKPKDYKFSRISGLTRVIAVRASAYGAYAAVRRDCNVTKTQVVVEDQTLWQDIFPLLCFNDLRDAEEVPDSESEEPELRFWQGRKKPDELALLKRHLLESKDVEKDLEKHLRQDAADDFADYDVVLGTTVSEIRIPVHHFVLAGRSRVLRQGFHELRQGGNMWPELFAVPDLFVCERGPQGKPLLMFQGIDILALVNFVLYCYTDNVVDYWHYTRRSPQNAFRYRQIRTELMKIASKLDLHHLEPAVRQMIETTHALNMDLDVAVKDPSFFENGDIRVQLADQDILVHRALICQRCPFFEGLFMGRAGGRWLEERIGQLSDASEAVAVDLKHIESRIFRMVLRYIYADTGEELFDGIVSTDLDEFLDVVMEVMSVANELMLDRLSQVCQKVVGRYVNVRNVCGLLNAIAPSSVTEFKDAALEYLCLSLEAMLQGGLLDELDDDLLLELDNVVRDNQLAYMPFAKSGRAEALLHERHPELAALIDRDRQAKIDSILLHTKYHDPDIWAAGSFKAYSLDDDQAPSPTQLKARRKSSKEGQSGLLRPMLKGKDSARNIADLDSDGSELGKSLPRDRVQIHEVAVGTPPADVWYDSNGKQLAQDDRTPGTAKGTPRLEAKSPALAPSASPSLGPSAAPWASATPSPGAKLGMKDIMAQASSSRVSNLSLGLAATHSSSPDTSAAGPFGSKLSQKERKKMQQAQQAALETTSTPPKSDSEKPSSPWQIASATKVPSLKDVIDGGNQTSTSPKPPVARTTTTPQLTMRQTIANAKPAAASKSIGPGAQLPAQQQRSVSGPAAQAKPDRTPTKPAASPSASSRPTPSPHQPTPTPRKPSGLAAALAPVQPPDLSSSSAFPSIQSIRHQPRPVEPSLQLSMADILAQQQAEKDIIQEAKAARSLQDIQAEQEFMEWWDKEAARMREEEELMRNGRGAGGESRGRRGKRGGKGAGPKAGGPKVTNASDAANTVNSAGGRGAVAGGRGRGGSARGGGGQRGGRGGAVPVGGAERGKGRVA